MQEEEQYATICVKGGILGMYIFACIYTKYLWERKTKYIGWEVNGLTGEKKDNR